MPNNAPKPGDYFVDAEAYVEYCRVIGGEKGVSYMMQTFPGMPEHIAEGLVNGTLDAECEGPKIFNILEKA